MAFRVTLAKSHSDPQFPHLENGICKKYFVLHCFPVLAIWMRSCIDRYSCPCAFGIILIAEIIWPASGRSRMKPRFVWLTAHVATSPPLIAQVGSIHEDQFVPTSSILLTSLSLFPHVHTVLLGPEMMSSMPFASYPQHTFWWATPRSVPILGACLWTYRQCFSLFLPLTWGD